MKKLLSAILFGALSLVPCLAGTPPASIFVDGLVGSDTVGNGNFGNPYKTLHKARIVAQANLLGANCSGITAPIVIMFRGSFSAANPELYPPGVSGTPATEAFTSSDSGCSASHPIIYKSFPGEYAVISGGTRITNWTNVSSNLWQVTLADGTYTEGLWYNGARRFRPRLNVTSDNVGAYGSLDATTAHVLPSDTCTNGLPGCSGGTNSGCTTFTSGGIDYCWDRVRVSASSTATLSAAWANLTVGTAPTADILYAQPQKWDWAYERITGIDTTNHLITFSGVYQESCVSSGIAACNQGPSFESGGFMIENVKDLFTHAGQWFLDRTGAHPILKYLANNGEDPNADSVVIASVAAPLVTFSGTQHIKFIGLGVSHDNTVVPDTGYASLQAETPLSAALQATNVTDFWLDRFTVSHTMGNGAWATTNNSGTSSGVHFINSSGFDCGAGCFYLGRFTTSGSDTDANVLQNSEIRNTHVYGAGRVYTAAYGLGVMLAHDVTVDHNEVHDTYYNGIGICVPGTSKCKGGASSHGNFNIRVTFNKVYDALQGMNNDGGGIYVVTFTYPNVVVANNRVFNVNDRTAQGDITNGYGGNCYYFDDVDSGVLITNNLGYRCSNAVYKLTAGPQTDGQPDLLTNNIAAYSRKAFVLQGFGAPATSIQQWIIQRNLFYTDKQFTSNPTFSIQGTCGPSSPYLASQLWKNNVYYSTATDWGDVTYTKAMFTNDVDCVTLTRTNFASWQALGEDVGSQVPVFGVGIPFTAPAYPTDNYALPGGYTGSVGFVPFSTTAPGLTRSVQPSITPAPIAGWPTAQFAQDTGY